MSQGNLEISLGLGGSEEDIVVLVVVGGVAEAREPFPLRRSIGGEGKLGDANAPEKIDADASKDAAGATKGYEGEGSRFAAPLGILILVLRWRVGKAYGSCWGCASGV